VIARRLILLGALPLFVEAAGCHHAVRTDPTIAPDSLTGVVSITGTSFEQQLVLRWGSTATVLSASGSDSAALSRMGGIEVLVVGNRAEKQFRVVRFTALSVAGSHVVDGVIREDGGRLVLETAAGRIPLGNPPSALRNAIGARVWIGGPLDTGPNNFGVIAPP
jgi:hypothetical protein